MITNFFPRPRKPGKEVIVEQNTNEWLELRRGPRRMRVGGSEAATACGISNYCRSYSFYDHIIELMEGGKEEHFESAPTIHGHRCEPLVADIYEKITGNKTEEANYWVSAETPNWWGCSPDRKVYINGKFEGLLEIKSPYYK